MTSTISETYSVADKFAARREALNNRWLVELQFAARVIGGIPAANVVATAAPEEQEGQTDKAKGIMNAWLTKNLADKMSEEQIAELADVTFDEAYKDATELASTTFKADERGLYLEGRCVKAMLKEAGQRIGLGKPIAKAAGEGKARPSLRQDLHEALHVDEDQVYLMRDGRHITAPDGYEERPIHTVGPKGPQSAIKRFAFVERPTVAFTLRILNMVALQESHLIDILAFGQDLGLGADRSQGNGKFSVVGFERS